MNLKNLTAPDQWTLSDNSLLRRILVCFLGEVITAVGIAICLEGKSGVDPFTAFLQGISHVSGISFSAIVPIVNIIMLILVLPFDRSIFGLGTVVNFTIVGVLVDYVPSDPPQLLPRRVLRGQHAPPPGDRAAAVLPGSLHVHHLRSGPVPL